MLFMMQRADKRRHFCKTAHLFAVYAAVPADRETIIDVMSYSHNCTGRSNVRPADSHTATPGSS